MEQWIKSKRLWDAEGAWTIEIHGKETEPAGILIMTTGRVLGGDDTFGYTGGYTIERSPRIRICAEIQIVPLTPTSLNPFTRYLRSESVTLDVSRSRSRLKGEVWRRGDRNVTLPVTLRKRRAWDLRSRPY